MRKIFFMLILGFLVLTPFLLFSEEENFTLPSAVSATLDRLAETYNVLDQVSEKIWPGWTNYKEFPFMFEFENRLRILVGHPNPPEDFDLMENVNVGGKPVYIDKSKLVPMELKEPLSGGGGIIPYGTTKGGKRISIVRISLKRRDPGRVKDTEDKFRTESQILLYIHELFHCFQADHVQIGYGNLSYNPDIDYAVYSKIEGMALRKAYREKDVEKAKGFLKDFVLAREIKRKSMTDMQQKQESSDDVREGTAVYSEVRALESIKEDFKPGLNEKDPYYNGFVDMNKLITKYTERMDESIEEIYDPKMKCYNYGCYQALLLQRFFPGWQEPFAKEPHYLDDEIRTRLTVSEEEKADIHRRFREIYDLEKIKGEMEKIIKARDAAYFDYKNQEGKSYILSFKEIKEFVSARIDEEKKSHRLGLINMYPEGIGSFDVDEISLETEDFSAVIDRLYYIKYLDEDWEERKDPVSLHYEKKEPGGIFIGVTLKTPFFILKAPKIRIKDKGNRYKIWILSRVSKK